MIGDAAVAQRGVGAHSKMGSAGGWCWPVAGDGETGMGDGRVSASVVHPSCLPGAGRGLWICATDVASAAGPPDLRL